MIVGHRKHPTGKDIRDIKSINTQEKHQILQREPVSSTEVKPGTKSTCPPLAVLCVGSGDILRACTRSGKYTAVVAS